MVTNLRTAALAATLSAAVGMSPAQAQDFSSVDLPSTIRVVVAYNAGGSSDTLARITMPAWEAAIEELSGQSTKVIVANQPGAGGQIGWTNLAAAKADGGTIGIINLPAVPLVEKTRDAAYKPWLEAFAALGVNVIDPNVIRLSSSSKHESLTAAIEAAKADPGSVVVGADGPLSDDHAAMYALEQATGAKFTFIPFSGSAPANTAFLGGEVDIAIGNVFDHVKTVDGAKEAAVLRAKRYDLIPDVPTLKEAAGIELPELGSVRGFATQGKVSPELVALYRAGFEKIYADDAFIAEMRAKNMTTVAPKVGEAFEALMQDQETLSTSLVPLFEAGGFLK